MWSTAELMLTTSKPLPLLSRELLRTGDGAGGLPSEMGGVADMQVCFSVKLMQNCDH